MAQQISINTKDYNKKLTIQVDGNKWTMSLPGAADELAMSQANRRAQRIQKKIEADTATDEEYDLLDKLEAQVYENFTKMFSDGTKDNAQVKAWLASTPLEIVQVAIQEIQRQAEEKKTNEADATTTAAAITE